MKIRVEYLVGPKENSDDEERYGAFTYNTVSPHLAARAALHTIAESQAVHVCQYGGVDLTVTALDDDGNPTPFPINEPAPDEDAESDIVRDL